MNQTLRKSILFFVALLLSLTSYAYDFKVDGIYYQIRSSTEKTCNVISSSEKYTGDIAIPSKVTYGGTEYDVVNICDGAFFECTELMSVTIPTSVVSIGYVDPRSDYIGIWGIKGSFEGCTALTNIYLPDSLQSIGDYAFYGCSSLTSINIPNSVTSIGASAFQNCGKLTSIIIPDNVKKISMETFSGCKSLTSIKIPDELTAISCNAFAGCI